MNLIFEHEDGAGDRIKIRECLDHLVVESEDGSDGGEVEVRLPHDRVAALHAALGEWLGRTTAPIASNSLIDQLIVKRVAEEVARVLPLHLSPLAFKSDAERRREEPEPQHAKYEDAHSPLCPLCGQLWTDTHGQPGYPCVRKGDKGWGLDGIPPSAPYCTECMHSWSRHTGLAHGCNAVMTAEVARPYCGCKRVQS